MDGLNKPKAHGILNLDWISAKALKIPLTHQDCTACHKIKATQNLLVNYIFTLLLNFFSSDCTGGKHRTAHGRWV